MKYIAVTQRICIDNRVLERRDCLDQRWMEFLKACNLTPIILPNNLTISQELLHFNKPIGILLTGGNTLSSLSGDSPERDIVERETIKYADLNNIPIFGVCRGMQMLQEYEGQKNFVRVDGHVKATQQIHIEGITHTVNSYHDYATFSDNNNWIIWALSDDGVIKAIKHRCKKFYGIMWHPERISPFREYDILLFKRVFVGKAS